VIVSGRGAIGLMSASLHLKAEQIMIFENSPQRSLPLKSKTKEEKEFGRNIFLRKKGTPMCRSREWKMVIFE